MKKKKAKGSLTLKSRRPRRKRVPSQDEKASMLYVWFHGLVGFYFERDHITVVTPDIPEHSYLAGAWMRELPLKKGVTYALSGVSDPKRPNQAPTIDPAKDTLLTGVPSVDLDNSFFQIRMPFPRRIIPLRYVPAAFAGKASQQLRSPFPLVHLFEYEVKDSSRLRLKPLEGWPIDTWGASTHVLHVFAEPKGLVIGDHAMHAFQGLIKLFPGTDLQLRNIQSLGPPLDLNVPRGLDPIQEYSLAERPQDVYAKGGAQPANCFALIAQAT